MSHKFVSNALSQELIIEPVSLQRTRKTLQVWKHPSEGTSHIVAQRGDQNISYHLDRSDTAALAKQIDPEAQKAKELVAQLKALYDGLNTTAEFESFGPEVMELLEEAFKE